MNYDRVDLESLAWQLRVQARRHYAMRTTEEINEEVDRVAAFFKRNQRGMMLGMQQAAQVEDAR
jgi:hypothetical protein